MSLDLKTSLLVNRQVPEFVRDEYPTFVTFLEAYYQFLEGTANTGTTANNLVTTAKSLRDIRDVDSSLEEFQTNFYNTYASLIPLDVQANKELLFKHLVPLYKTKGSDASFKLLFRLIFGVDIDVILPKNNVLKASSSKWQIDNKLRINQDVASVYNGDGVTKTFTLAQIVGEDEISVFVNDVLQSNFFVNKEFRKLNFNSAPANNSTIRVVYDSFDTNLLNNRKVTGLKSGASAVIEQANRRIISDSLNLGLPIELLINTDSLDGSFLNGEYVTIPIINPDDPYGNTINIQVSTFSIVKQFNIIDGGYNYQIGDPVIVTGGNASVNAIGTVSSIFKGLIESVAVSRGGSGFANPSPILVSGNGAVTLTITVDGIDQSGTNAANSFIVSTDVVSPYSSTVLSSANYAFANSIAVTSPNINTRIVDVIGFQTLSVGPITNVKVLVTSGATPTTPTLDAFGAPYGPNAGSIRTPKSLRSIGKIKINNPGSGYVVGDEIVFGLNPPGTYGQYAAATVEAVTPTGGIVTVGMANTRIQGTVDVSGSSVSGTGTRFLTDLRKDDKIDVNGESRIVSTIFDDLTASVTSAFTYSSTGKKIGVFGRNPKGGINYVQNNFPTVTVSSVSGVGASIEIDSLVSDGESIFPTGVGQPGEILEIQVLNPGSGYEYIPIVTITGGSGTATANADIERSYLSSPGRWITSDSIISSTERKLAGQDYYVDYSYVISSQIEFYRYKQILKDLLHPVGFVKYADFNKSNTIDLTDVSVSTANVATDEQFLTVSGNVSVGNGSIRVAGMSTKFNVAVARNIIVPGTTRIAVNGEIRTVNSVVSNTSLLVSSNVNDIWIANAGSGYSNGFLVFANGGGTITSLSIINTGSGYESGNVVLSNADEAIPAVATVVANANGCLQSVTLVSGGLYSGVPIALPATEPHKVLYANSITITNRGAGYVNGFLNFTGGAPIRPANVSVQVYPSNGAIQSLTINDSGLYESNPTSASPNSSANVVVSNVFSSIADVGGGHSNGIIIFSGGGTANRSAQVAVEVYSSNGAVRKYTILDSGLYTTTPTAVLNTTPVSISTIVSNTAPAFTYGRFVSNGYITFTGGDPVINANARIYVFSNGNIQNVTVLNVGLYRSAPSVAPDTSPVSVTQVLPLEGGSGYANGYIVLEGGGANTNADVSIVVNGTGSIVRTVINNIGLYTGNSNITVKSVNSLVTGLPQAGTGATFRVSVNANTSNVPVLSTTTSANAFYTANVTVTANSNSVTNATFTMSGVSNTETVAVIDVGFTGSNTSAVGTVEVYPSNGAIRRVTISTPGEYFYRPDVTPDSGGTGAVIRVNSVGSFSQTANGQEMIIWK
jgi:hypothetical protein